MKCIIAVKPLLDGVYHLVRFPNPKGHRPEGILLNNPYRVGSLTANKPKFHDITL